MSQNKTALVTGAFGFLGRNCSQLLHKKGYKVFGIGHGEWGDLEASSYGISRWVSADINLKALCELKIKPDFIVHCGGSGSVARSILDPYIDFQRTVETTASVLEFIRKYSHQTRLIYPSSPAVHGLHDEKPIKVTDLMNPVSPYGFHKKMAEELCISYFQNFGVKYSIIRFFSIYGEGLTKQLLWDASTKLTSGRERVEFWGSGDEIRDWIHVSDASELIYASAISEDPSILINGGSGNGKTVREVLDLLKKCLNTDVELSFNGASKPGDPKFYTADSSNFLDGWSPSVSFHDGIKAYAEWFRKLPGPNF